MKFFGLRDEEGRKLLDFLGSAATPHTWKVIPWSAVLKEVWRLLPRLANEVPTVVLASIRAPGVSIAREPAHSPDRPPLDRNDGERILGFYFAQLRSPAGLFLDLRPERWSARGNETVFSPSRVWVQWSTEFRQAVLDLYEGHYLAQDELLASATIRLGMLDPGTSASSPDFQALKKILTAHFGPGDQRAVEFSLEAFRKSFDAWFEFLARDQRKLSAEFAMLGAALVGLYLTLERIGVPLDARAAYLSSRTSPNP